MPKSLIVMGSGAIGIEFASFYRTLGVDVTVIPFDADALIDSLIGAAPTPQPAFAALVTELSVFEPDTASARRRVDGPWLALRDSTQNLSDSLFAIGRSAPGYAAAYERFRRDGLLPGTHPGR